MATVRLILTLAEARALSVLAGEGREALLTDEAAAAAYLGGKRAIEAAIRACDKLDQAIAKAEDKP